MARRSKFWAPTWERAAFCNWPTRIVYPMTRALYGRRIRQPIGGDFGFSRMEKRVETRQKVRSSEAVPIFGFQFEVGTEPVSVNVKRMIESFQRGCQDLQDVYRLILPPATMLDLKRTAASPVESFSFDDDLWVRTVYDYALGHRLRVIDRDHLLRSLTSLYRGWVASFIRPLGGESGPPGGGNRKPSGPKLR